MKKYKNFHSVCKEHEVDLHLIRSKENILWLLKQATKYPCELARMKDLIRISPPIELGEYLDKILDSADFKRYEYVKALIALIV